jgi:hypothetical protein
MRSEQPEGGLRDQVILVTKDWSKVAGFATCGSLFGWSLDWSWVGATAPARKIEDHVGGSKEAPFREILYVCATAWQVLKAMAWKHTVSARMAHLMFRLTEHLPATSANMNWRKKPPDLHRLPHAPLAYCLHQAECNIACPPSEIIPRLLLCGGRLWGSAGHGVIDSESLLGYLRIGVEGFLSNQTRLDPPIYY